MSNFLIEEYNQAWEHYRHIENARSKYMNFFYTALFAVMAASYIVFKDAREGNDTVFSFSIVLVLLHFMNIFNAYIYLNIKKFGLALSHYENTINNVRKIKVGTSYSRMLDVRNDSIMKNRWFSVQTTAQVILIFMMLVSNTTVIWFTFYYATGNYAVLIVSMFICLLIMAAQTAGIIQRRKREKPGAAQNH